MTKLGKKHQKQLAKLVTTALICAGGGLFSPPSVASAEEVTVTGVGGSSGAYTVTSIPDGAMQQILSITPPGNPTNWFYAPTADVLNITGAISANNIRFYGGYNRNPGTCVSGKTVNINGTTIFVNGICGGVNESGNVEGNTVNVASGTITISSIEGGLVDKLTLDSASGSALGNHVNITGGTINPGGYGGIIYGGNGALYGDAENNTVTISGGEINASDIRGGSTAGSGKKANGNVVTIHGGTVNGPSTASVIFGGCASSILGANGNEASGNTVTIDGGTVNVKRIYGGSAGRITSVVDTEASGNTVTIEKDATLGSDTCILGGYAASGWGYQTPGTTNNNTVNILKAITVKQIVGGSNATAGTGNALNISAIGVTVGDCGVTGFQNMNFFLPDGAAGKTMLTVNEKDEYENGVATDLTGVTIGAAVQAGANFNKGDTVNLITNPSGLTTDGTTTLKQITDETVTIQTKPTAKTLTTDQSYKLEVSQKDANTIIATITDKEEEQNGDRAKSLVETRAATTTFVNAGADMLASQGFTQAANAVALKAAENAKNGAPGAQNAGGFTPFAAFGGSSMRAESGSYVDTKGFGLNVGFARELPNSQGKLLFGPVVEYGGGNYDSHLNDGTRGDGKAHYFGVGVMARQVNHDGFYYEGSLRGGRVTSDYKGDLDSIGRVNYDSSSNYFAAHLGVGKAFDLGKGNTLDGYFKYFYSHQTGDDTTIHIAGMADERGHFDAVDSHRIRIGARLTHKVNERNSFYGGLAYQYEFNGDARATFSGNGVPSPSLKGSSGLLELGWQVKPGEGPLKLDLGVTGWAGKQRGGNVQLGATWTF
ncbi:autotransporter outer membrane beta-barrel domain-containing protein [Selenomonas ruminantium]|uniref:Autotransporter domain-containing protein n=1 Tax=Selenomonas ruminantium TaxID=971 RepID=A0A1H0QI69_SELRU|nr:autotransporter outer membrane beta-barrel domain-containing protein [Selenomonas ruminantium]SDP16900.1 hypothetical protein SAMN05216366_10818 [Selenomonas ruminantium]